MTTSGKRIASEDPAVLRRKTIVSLVLALVVAGLNPAPAVAGQGGVPSGGAGMPAPLIEGSDGPAPALSDATLARVHGRGAAPASLRGHAQNPVILWDETGKGSSRNNRNHSNPGSSQSWTVQLRSD
ncbi:MAG TPA: hypothetical protein VKA64_10645 [Gammaproteobacteria bacterium]|nr:hypothetical protein [Gammaproteobacteria bacterium]